jgi:hypothetical protein
MSPTPATTPAATSSVTIHEATRVAGGVRRGALLTAAQAEARRRAGLDVVVCGNDTFANCNAARRIETAVGPCYHDGLMRRAACKRFRTGSNDPGRRAATRSTRRT